MTEFGQIENIWSEEELGRAEKILDALPDQINVGNGKNAYTNGIDQQHFLYRWAHNFFAEKIMKEMNIKMKIWHLMLLKEFSPWTVHTDWNKGDQKPFMAFLIPLSWQGSDSSQTHTIIFNEKCTTNTRTFCQESSFKEPNCRNLYDNLCRHVEPEVLDKLTLAGAYRWKRGNMLYWDRSLLHCSDDFLGAGIVSKKAIVIFTSAID